MDWIETIFGISPDGGNGATEALIIGTAIATVALIAMRIGRFRSNVRRH